MKIDRMIASAGSLLLGSLLLSGCSEPSQPAAVTEPPAAEAASTPPAVVDDSVAPAELSLDERRLPMVAVTSCNLERANKVVFSGAPLEVSKSGGPVRVSGWIADQAAGSVPAKGDLRMVGVQDNRAWKFGVETGGNRGDVVKLLGGEAAYASSGFGATVDFSGMPSGSYRMYTVFTGSDGLKVCDNGRSITLTE
jgi:hypothetical protein